MEQYPSELAKLSLAMESSRMAKALLVEIQGIGQDLPATLMCWRNHRIVSIIQATDEVMSQPPSRKLSDLSSIALIAKSGWSAESMTLTLEGYCQLDNESTDDRPLDQAFIDNPSVTECLTFIHVEDDDPIIAVCPYKMGLGRVTEFLEPRLSHKESFRPHFEPLVSALRHEPPEATLDPDRRERSARTLIESLGWSVPDHPFDE